MNLDGILTTPRVSGKPLVLSTQCKACKKDFTESTIFKHIIFKKFCTAAHTEKEIQLYRQWSKK